MSEKLHKLIERSRTLSKKGALTQHEGYQELVDVTSFLPPDAFVSTRIWHVEHNMYSIPLCKTCNKPVKWRKEQQSYNTYCSSKCAHADPLVNQKMMDTNLERYGTTCAMNSENIRQKIVNCWVEKYGVDNPSKHDKIRQKISNSTHLSRNKNADKDTLIKSLIESKLTQQEIGNTLNISQPRVSHLLARKNLKTLYTGLVSMPHREITTFLSEHNIEFLENQKIIPPYHVDIFIPTHNIALEYNGTFWHSELKGRDRHYHLNKTKMCLAKNINLIHIFEHDWNANKQLVFSRLLHKLGSVTQIYARKCSVQKIEPKQASTFYENNHTQGGISSTHNYGLFFNETLVACMSFSASRYNKNYDLELTRYATLINFGVIGGASKLFKFAINELSPSSIITYSELKWGHTNFYAHLGFTFDGYTPPNYYYFSLSDSTKLFSRIQFQKHKLTNMLESFDPELTEWENMVNNRYDRLWDCGNMRWIWKQK